MLLLNGQRSINSMHFALLALDKTISEFDEIINNLKHKSCLVFVRVSTFEGVSKLPQLKEKPE